MYAWVVRVVELQSSKQLTLSLSLPPSGEVQAMRPAVELALKQLTAHEEVMQSVSTQFNEALALYRKSVSHI